MPDTGRPGREFVGLARRFRNAVVSEDALIEAAFQRLDGPILARLRRKPKLRPEQPRAIVRAWVMTLPADFRLGPPLVVYQRGGFAITETRLTASWITDDAWGHADRECGVGLCTLTFAVRDGALMRLWQPLANVSLHALARRIERGADAQRDHVALARDLAVLAQANGTGERVDTVDGFWLGSIIQVKDESAGKACRMRSVRTWVAA
jgi:hypothetical protein